MSFTELRCPKCKVRFLIQSDFVDAFRDKGRAFYCPNSYCPGAIEKPTMLCFPNGKKKIAVAESA